MAIEREILRSCILEALRREPGTQYINLQSATARVLVERGLPVRPGQHPQDPHLAQEDLRRFRELVWSLITQGVVTPGKDDNNQNWPWLSLTEWGEEYARGGPPDVYDPEGYLADLEAVRPLDAVERRFLGQAIAAFRVDLPDASAVMLGVAAEHLILQLLDQLEAADPIRGSEIRRASGTRVLPLLRELTAYFLAKRKDLPRRLGEEIETTFAGISSFIRVARNDAGHPDLAVVSRDRAFTMLRLFAVYRHWVADVSVCLPL
jgi:hypothetical protein